MIFDSLDLQCALVLQLQCICTCMCSGNCIEEAT